MTRKSDQRYPRDTRRLLVELERRGASVLPLSGTGEMTVTHPKLVGRIRVSVASRRKDAPMALVRALRALDRLADEPADR